MRQATWRFFGNVKEGRNSATIVAVLQAKPLARRTEQRGGMRSVSGGAEAQCHTYSRHASYMHRSETPCCTQDLAVMCNATLCTVHHRGDDRSAAMI